MRKLLARYWIAVILGAATAIVAGGWLLSQYMKMQAAARAQEDVKATFEQVRARLDAEVNNHVLAVQRMAERSQRRPDLPEEEWKYNATQALGDFPGLVSLAWLNIQPGKEPTPDNLEILYSLPTPNATATNKLHLVVRKDRFALLAKMLATRTQQFTDPVNFGESGRGFAVYVPAVKSDGTLIGVAMGIFKLDETMNQVFRRLVSEEQSITVKDGYQPVYERGRPKLRPQDWDYSGDISILNSKWRLVIWPDPQRNSLGDQLSGILMLGSALLAALVSGTIYWLASRPVEAQPQVVFKSGTRSHTNGTDRRRLNEKVRVWEAAIMAISEPILVLESEKIALGGTPVLFANEAFTNATGWSTADLQGKTPRVFFGAVEAKEVAENLRPEEGERREYTHEQVLESKDGRRLQGEFHWKPVLDDLRRCTHWIMLAKNLRPEGVAAPAVAPGESEAIVPQSIGSGIDVLANVLAATPLAAVVTNMEGHVTHWNHAAEALFGYRTEEVVGKEPPFEVTEGAEAASALLENPDKPWREMIQRKSKFGDSMQLEATTTAVRDGSGDITALLSLFHTAAPAVAAAPASTPDSDRERHFGMLVENVADVLAVLDASHQIRYANPAAQRVLGYAPEQLAGKPLRSFVAAGADPLEAGLTSALHAETLPMEPALLSVKQPDGSTREVEYVLSRMQNAPFLLMSLRPALSRATAAPAADNSITLRLLEEAPDSIVLLDANDNVLWMNRLAAELYKTPLADCLGKSGDLLLKSWIQAPDQSALKEAIDEIGFWKGEIRQISPDGRELVLDCSSCAIADENGKRIGVVTINRDITLLRSAEEALRHAEDKMNAPASTGSWDWDLQNDRILVSRNLQSRLGYQSAGMSAVASEWFDLVHPDDRPTLYARIEQHRTGAIDRLVHDFRLRTQEGDWKWMKADVVARRNESGQPLRIIGAISDINDQVLADDELLLGAFTDKTTGLANEKLFLEKVSMLQDMVRRGMGKRFALLHINLDRFKVVNENVGRRAGDQALGVVAERLRSLLPGNAELARLEGDTFGILQPGIDAAKEGVALAQQILQAMKPPVEVQGRGFYLQASIGVLNGPLEKGGVKELLALASETTARAKAEGRGRFALHGQPQPAARPALTREEFLRALEQRQFELRWQPVVMLLSGEINTLCAELVWRHPSLGLLAGEQFLHAAEATGAIDQLDQFLLSEAASEVVRLRRLYPEAVEARRLTIRPSMRHLAADKSMIQLVSAAAQAGLPLHHLILDLNENILTMPGASEVLTRMGRVHAQISLRDPASSRMLLSRLSELPFDTVCLCGALLETLGSNEGEQAFTQLLQQAARHGVRVMVDGVASLEQVARLRDLSTPLARGRYFSAPLTTTELQELLNRRPRW
jgi:diguanylate cyclase (GGDEF)-like protein/PAS domain S-box-containing protein